MVSSPFFSICQLSVLIGGRLRSLAPLFPSLCGLLAGLTLLTGRYLVLFRMPGMCTGMNLGLYLLPHVVLALGDAVCSSSVDDFWSIWSKSAEAGLF